MGGAEGNKNFPTSGADTVVNAHAYNQRLDRLESL